jgi:hypothetical protein
MALSTNKSHGKMPGLCPPYPSRLPFHLIQIRKDLFRSLQKSSSRTCKFYAPARPLQQRHSDRSLKQTNLGANRGLRYAQKSGGAGKTQLIGHGREITQVSKLHQKEGIKALFII